MFREQRLQGERRMQQGIYEREKERKKEGKREKERVEAE